MLDELRHMNHDDLVMLTMHLLGIISSSLEQRQAMASSMSATSSVQRVSRTTAAATAALSNVVRVPTTSTTITDDSARSSTALFSASTNPVLLQEGHGEGIFEVSQVSGLPVAHIIASRRTAEEYRGGAFGDSDDD